MSERGTARGNVIHARAMDAQPSVTYLTAAQLADRYHKHIITLKRWMATRDFPKAVQFGGPTSPRLWRVEDVEKWERASAARSDHE